jgi:hypothetical protein
MTLIHYKGGFGSLYNSCALSLSKMLCEYESGINDSILTEIKLSKYSFLLWLKLALAYVGCGG